MRIAPTAIAVFAVSLLLANPLAAQAVWTRVYPTASPGPRHFASMAFDAAHGVAVLVGGYVTPGAWQWTGSAWSAMASGPANRAQAAMVFDAARSRVVLFGGFLLGSSTNGADTWE